LKLLLAEHAGFCFGVGKAIAKVDELINKKEKAYTLGPIIHNPQVVEKLKNQGIVPVNNLEDVKNNNIIIRAHGVGPDVIQLAKNKGLNIIDCTCPFVKRVQNMAKEMSESGVLVIIIGDPHHPEVLGIKNWCPGDVKIIENVEDAKNFFTNREVGIVVQTTQTKENVDQIMEVLEAKLDIGIFNNTRCVATLQRQQAAAELAKKVNVMLVIGGRNSSNTKKLVKVCENSGAKTFHIETSAEIKSAWFSATDKVGITAGASTPDWIIKEVISKMDELNNDLKKQEVENEREGEITYEGTFKDINEGSIVDGTVVKVSDNEVLVNVGFKSDGIIPLNELSNSPVEKPSDILKVGDEISVYVLKLEDKDGNLLLSKKRADSIKTWEKLEKAYKNEEEIEGIVTEVVKGGMLADVNGIKGFIPASHSDLRYIPDLNIFVGQKLKFKILELDATKNRLVMSRKLVMEAEKEKLSQQTWASIEEGQVIKGVVRRLTDFGAFVDIGGVDGLIHISDLAWHRVGHPSEIVEENQEIEVKVLKVDKERERISLGLKQVLPDPWENVENKYEIGSIIEGKVVKLVSFGAFVEVEPGIEGLVHISQISKEHIPTPQDVLSVGEKVKVKLLDINAAEKKMSLSIKEALDEEKTPISDNYEKPSETGITIGEMVGDVFNKKED